MEPEPAPWGDKILSNGGELIYYYPLENAAPYVSQVIEDEPEKYWSN